MSSIEIFGLALACGEVLLTLLPQFRKLFRYKKTVRHLTTLCEQKLLQLRLVISSLNSELDIPHEVRHILEELCYLEEELVSIYHKNPFKRFRYALERESDLISILDRLSILLDNFKFAKVVLWGISKEIHKLQETIESHIEELSLHTRTLQSSEVFIRSSSLSFSSKRVGEFLPSPRTDSKIKAFLPSGGEIDILTRTFSEGHRFDEMCLWMGNRLQRGSGGVRRDVKQSFRFYEYSWSQGNSKAALNIGWCYATGTGVTRDYSIAARYYWHSSTKSNSDAMINLAALLTNGVGVPKNINDALNLLSQASALNHDYADFAKAQIHLRHIGGPEHEKIAYWTLKSLEKSQDSHVLNELGVCYSQGRGVERNIKKSFNLFKKAAEKKDFWGIINLSISYLYGYGVERNEKESKRLVNQAKSSYDESFIALDMISSTETKWGSDGIGYMYEHGIGVRRNLGKALQFYKAAANAGNEESWLHVARIYESDVRRDISNAYKYYRKSAEAGSSYGLWKANSISKILSNSSPNTNRNISPSLVKQNYVKAQPEADAFSDKSDTQIKQDILRNGSEILSVLSTPEMRLESKGSFFMN